MTEPYSLHTLAAPELRRDSAFAFGVIGANAALAGYATAAGIWLGAALCLVAIVGGLVGLSRVDERAREISA